MQLLRGKVIDKSRYRSVNVTHEATGYSKVRNILYQKQEGNEYKGWT